MSMWQATKLHLIAMGVWGAQIHWSVKSVMDMYNMFLLVAFAESRAKSPCPAKCQTSSSDSSTALSNPYLNIHREWKCNDYIRPCWGWGETSADHRDFTNCYWVNYSACVFNKLFQSGIRRARHQFPHDEEKKKTCIELWCCKRG